MFASSGIGSLATTADFFVGISEQIKNLSVLLLEIQQLRGEVILSFLNERGS